MKRLASYGNSDCLLIDQSLFIKIDMVFLADTVKFFCFVLFFGGMLLEKETYQMTTSG